MRRAKSGFTKLGTIKRWIKESTDLDHYDLMFALQLFMAGDKRTIDGAMRGRILSDATYHGARVGGELPDYGEIMPGIGQIGTMNHAEVNAKINVAGLSMDPEFVFAHPDPLIRAVNAAYVRDLWVSQGWDSPIYMAGIEMECNGMGSVHWGVSDGGRPNIRHSPNLDTLYDRSKREPGRWEWVCVRNRLSPEEAEQIYGDALTDLEIKNLTEDEPDFNGDAERRRTGRKMVYEWSWYSRDEHVVWLGGIHGQDKIPLKLNSRNEYVKCGQADSPNADEWEAGPNPFGVIPHSWWIDGWIPGVPRPRAKMETTIRLAAMLNQVERYIVNTLRFGVSVTTVDSTRIDQDILEKIKGAQGWEALEQIILTEGGGLEGILQRTPAAELPAVALQLRSILKDEMNAATGVGDMQRGQALGGERRTRYEVNALLDQSGVQARFMRKEFAGFLRGVVNVCRTIGAGQDVAPRTLSLPDMEPVDLGMFPIKAFLEVDLPVEVNPNSLVFKTEEDRRQEAIIDLQQVHTPFIQMGVADAVKVMADTYRRLGYENPLKRFGFTPQEQMQRQMAQMQAEAAPPETA